MRSREREYIALVDVLEDEVRALREDRDAREEEYARRGRAHHAEVWQSLLRNVDVLREEVTGAVCGEVRDALADTLADHARRTRAFRQLLGKTEQLQASREQKDRALAETTRVASSCEGVEDDVDDGTRERTDLEKYFRKCIQNAKDSR